MEGDALWSPRFKKLGDDGASPSRRGRGELGMVAPAEGLSGRQADTLAKTGRAAPVGGVAQRDSLPIKLKITLEQSRNG